MALFEIKAGNKSILRIGSDKQPTASKTVYQVGNSPLDYFNRQYTSSYADFFEINSNKTIIKAVNECPQVSTILFRKGQQIANGISTVTQPNGKPMRGDEGKQWQKLINKPNVYMNRAQFVAVRDMYIWSWGWIAEYKETVPGFGIVSRRLLKPENCEIVWKKKSMFFLKDKASMIESFHYSENGVRTQIKDVENIYFYTGSNFLSTNGCLPETPLRTLQNPINSSIKNYKSRIRSISSPWGFVSQTGKDDVSNIRMDDADVDEFHKRYAENYGTEDGQRELVFANGPMQFNSIMPPVQALQLLELLKSDSAVICDVLGYEYDLLARDLGGVALNNKNEAGKNQYQNHTIPHAKNMDEQEMESLQAEQNGFIITTTFDHLPVMQADRKLESEARRNNVQSVIAQFKNNLICYGEAMEVLQSVRLVDGWRDKFWMDLTTDEQAMFDDGGQITKPKTDTTND